MSDLELRSRKQIAHAAGVCEKTITRWMKAGRLPEATKPGGKTSPVRVDRAALNRLLGKSI